MIKRALLVVGIDTLDVPRHLDPAIVAATTATSDTLVIAILSDALVPTAASWVQVQTLLAHVYVQASKAAHQQNNLLLDVSVLLNTVLSPDTIPPDIDCCFRVNHRTSPSPPHPSHPHLPLLLDVSLPDSLSSIPHTFLSSHPCPAPSSSSKIAQIPPSSPSPCYPVVALGGTFDHLHAGHKILLSMAAWIATRKVIVGITGTPPHSPLFSHSTLFSRRPSQEEIKPPSPRIIPYKSTQDSILSHAVPSGSRVRTSTPPGRVWSNCCRPRYPGPSRQQGNSLWRSCKYVSHTCPLCPLLISPSHSRQGARSQGLPYLAYLCHRCHLFGLFETRPRRCRNSKADKDEQYLHPPMDRFKSSSPLNFLVTILYTCIRHIIFPIYRLELNPSARLWCEFRLHQ